MEGSNLVICIVCWRITTFDGMNKECKCYKADSPYRWLCQPWIQEYLK